MGSDAGPWQCLDSVVQVSTGPTWSPEEGCLTRMVSQKGPPEGEDAGAVLRDGQDPAQRLMTRTKESQDEVVSGEHGSVLRAYEL